jgi:hypothetical protein
VTGGSDYKICIWNLLPAISLKYENPPKLTPPRAKEGNLSVIVEESKHNTKYHSVCCFVIDPDFRREMKQ